MNAENVGKLIASGENDAVEFKRARGGIPADFWLSYSAFANTDGGIIILGVAERNGKREIEGLEVGVETPEAGVKTDFEVLMGAYRCDFRENARRVLLAFAEDPEMDFVRAARMLGISENSVWRSVRALREVGLLVREGGDKGG